MVSEMYILMYMKQRNKISLVNLEIKNRLQNVKL